MRERTIDSPFWAVWDSRAMTFPGRYESPDLAMESARKMSKEHPGVKFYVMQRFGYYESSSPEWTICDDTKASRESSHSESCGLPRLP